MAVKTAVLKYMTMCSPVKVCPRVGETNLIMQVEGLSDVLEASDFWRSSLTKRRSATLELLLAYRRTDGRTEWFQ